MSNGIRFCSFAFVMFITFFDGSVIKNIERNRTCHSGVAKVFTLIR